MDKSEKNNAANTEQKEQLKIQPRIFSRFKMPEERLREAEAEKSAALQKQLEEQSKPKNDTWEDIRRVVGMRSEKNSNSKVAPQTISLDPQQNQTRSKPVIAPLVRQEIIKLDIQPAQIQDRSKSGKPAAIIAEEINDNSIVAPLPTRTEIISRQFSRKKIPTQKIIPAHSAVDFNKDLKLGSALDDDDFDSPRNPQSLDLDSSSNHFEQDYNSQKKHPAQVAVSSDNVRRSENSRPSSSARPKSNQSKRISDKGILGLFGLQVAKI